ncbi:hypothetical protein CCM_05009 [Cordyceps militaris CM01]|uniref:Uncharacterized protein n=1 Tax=Cordyceps militaris (strain CM01) TaxID=983644 RepID=G3JG16_CORMM|nr:uncharacterized protein CCM_05009 [Cordyceps militaris CM01]EGX93634.1 hypothetical protein CCM_05009 [Cordyceps militaris CM01]
MHNNTHCLAKEQIQGADNFTDDEIWTLIDFDPSRAKPCLGELHLARVCSTRLRVAVACHETCPEHDPVVAAKMRTRDKARLLALVYAVAYSALRYTDAAAVYRPDLGGVLARREPLLSGHGQRQWLAWPLTVAGDDEDAQAMQAFVDECHLAIWRMPDVSNSSITALDKLVTGVLRPALDGGLL